MKPPYPSSYGLNRKTTELPEGWIWHQITQEGWYAIKQTNNCKIICNALLWGNAMLLIVMSFPMYFFHKSIFSVHL